MNLLIILSSLVAALAFLPVAAALGTRAGRNVAWNTANTHPEGLVSLKPGEVLALRFLIGTRGSAADEVDIAAAGEVPLCVINDTADAADVTSGEPVSCQLLGAGSGTVRMVSAGVIPDDTDVYSIGAGKVDIVGDAATGDYRVGRSVSAAAGDGDLLEVVPCLPVYTVPA